MKKPLITPRTRNMLVAFGVALLVFVGCIGYVGWLRVPDVGPGTPLVLTSAEPHRVAYALREAKLIPNTWSFRVYSLFDRRTSRIKLGGYEIQPGSPYREIVSQLLVGTPKTEVKVRIIEGWTLDDIEAEVAQHGVSSTAVQASLGRSADRGAFADHWRDEFSFLRALPKNRSLEGYLFPDTYRVWKEQLPEALTRKQLQAFSSRVSGLSLTEKSAPLTSLDEVIRLASIVEKEVPTDEDRRLVAGVFLTRLREGMLLQSDATVEYVTASGRARSTGKDLQINSPFNTYRYKGLPPGPIGNPSLSAIRAVLNPDVQGYRYFLTDAEGKVYYGKTLAEHAANRTKAGYNR